MAICAGFSIAGWVSALMLGGLAAAKTAPGWLVFSSILIIHLAVLSVALRSAVTVNSRVRTAEYLFSQLGHISRTDPQQVTVTQDSLDIGYPTLVAVEDYPCVEATISASRHIDL